MTVAIEQEQRKVLKLRNAWGPLFLLLVCPPCALLIWFTHAHLQGSLTNLFTLFREKGGLVTLSIIWVPLFWGSVKAWKALALFAFMQLLFMKILPGKPFKGPITPQGNVPVYKANGFISFVVTLSLYSISTFYLGLFSPTFIYDHLGEMIGALNTFSLGFCLFLYFKGRFFPSSSDASSSKNFIFDFYWGTELYPRVLGWDVKKFTNCRFGMMSWSLILLSCAAKQQELYGLTNTMIVSCFLQLLYIAKFFLWETGYLRSLDIMHDRAGFYICWGCLVWVPAVYTSVGQYLVHHPYNLSFSLAFLLTFFGSTFILLNFWADSQRQKVRALEGNCKVWGKPPLLTKATYFTEQGEKKTTILLASGFWGIARHFHYIPELLGTLFWTLPALFSSFLPYFYFVYLILLLGDRAFRDDIRCHKKYGEDWEKHCEKVPYKIFPYVL